MFPDQPTATLLGAGLSAFVALMIVIITKEQKVSEFRQAWIDALRSDIAEAIGSASTLTIAMQRRDESMQSAIISEWAKVSAALSRIDLRLNLDEEPHRQLEDCVRNAELLIRRLDADSDDYESEEWIPLQDRVIDVSRPLLKREWNRVRKGEGVYRLAKGILTTIAVAVPLFYLSTLVCPDEPKPSANAAVMRK